MKMTGYMTVKDERVFDGDLFDVGNGALAQVKLYKGEWHIGKSHIDYFCNGATRLDMVKIDNIKNVRREDFTII